MSTTQGKIQNPQKKAAKRAKKQAKKAAVKAANKQASRAIKAAIRGPANNAMSGNCAKYSGGAERVARSISLPFNVPIERFSSEFTTQRTAIANPWSIDNVNFNTGTTTGTGAQLTKDLMFLFAFRDPLRARVQYDDNTAGTTWGYSAQGTTVNAGTATSTIPVTATTVPLNIHLVQAVSTQTYSPHDSVYYPGKDGETSKRYFWIDGTAAVTSTVTFTLAATPGAGTTVVFTIYRWSDVGEVIANQVTISNGQTTGTYSVTQSNYYAFAYNTTGAFAANTTTIGWSGTSSVWKHLAIPNMSTNVLAVDGVRISAVSLMFTNRASDLNRQGQLAMWQVPQDILWNEITANFASVSASQGAQTLPADKGCYLFLKPTQPRDFDYRTPFEVNGTSLRDAAFDLRNSSDYLAIAIQITNDSGGRDGYVTSAYGIEFLTDDPWRELDIGGDPLAFQEGLLMLKNVAQYHENPLHWKDIWQGIKNAGSALVKGAAKYGPLVGKMAAMLL